MATTDLTTVRTDDDRFDARDVFLPAAYAGQILAIVAAATGVAALLAGFTTGLGGFVLVAGGWLAIVSAAPSLAKRGTATLASLEFGRRAPRSARAVDAVVTYVLAR